MMVIIPHVMVEEPHKMAKALHILTEAPLEKTFHHLRQFWLSIDLHDFGKRMISGCYGPGLGIGLGYRVLRQ